MRHGIERNFSVTANGIVRPGSPHCSAASLTPRGRAPEANSGCPSHREHAIAGVVNAGPRISGDVTRPSGPGTADATTPQVDSRSRELSSLRDLFPTARFPSGQDVRFSTVADTAQAARASELVVYRIGRDCPVQVVAEAMARGAAGILTEQLLPCPLPQCVVGDVEMALATLACHRLDRPDRKLLTIGVVGSSGKTTTSLLVANLLRDKGIRTAYQTDLGQSDGIVQSTAADQLPTGVGLVDWLGEAADTRCKAAVIELSDAAARHGYYDAIELDVLIVTGTKGASDDFGPPGLQCALERVASDGVVVAPADDPKSMRTIRDSGVRMMTYGVRKSADLTAKIIEQSGGVTTLLVNHRDTTAVMETHLCGPAMAANHAAAALVGLLLSHPLHEVVESLGQLKSVPGRGQRIARFGEAPVVLDVAGTPHRAAAALRTFRSMKSNGRLWCVLAIEPTDPSDVLAAYGNLLERFADHAIVTTRPDAKASFLAASHAVLDGVQRCAAMRLVADRRRAIEWAIGEAGPHDTILILTGRRAGNRQEQRKELETVLSWIEKTWDDRAQPGPPVKLSIFS